MANKRNRELGYRVAEAVFMAIAMIAGGGIIANLYSASQSPTLLFACGVVFTGCLIACIRLWLDPDRVRATQTKAILNLASESLAAMNAGLDEASAQKVCDILLPATSAIAVAITNDQVILGYTGVDKDLNVTGAPVRTEATHAVLADGQARVLRSREEIGFPNTDSVIHAGIIVPLVVSGRVVGTLKFYYRRPSKITETQESVAAGFGELLSTQIAAANLEEQRKLATSMELKALQSQINPHFLFNTINTISSFTRTDPMKARTLLREFATFYRRTLEDSSDLISLAREVDQTQRYLQFEIARFGEDRLQFASSIPDDLLEVAVPSFMIQPLVENAVKHAMPAEGCLHIVVEAENVGDSMLLRIRDDGIGMSEEKRQKILHPESSTGLGIAVRNIYERVKGYYGAESYMDVESEEGKGTVITLYLKEGCACDYVAPKEVLGTPTAARRVMSESAKHDLAHTTASGVVGGLGGL